MQLANTRPNESDAGRRVRLSSRNDAPQVNKLLKMGNYVHIHVDWHLPGEWLGTPGFVVAESQRPHQGPAAGVGQNNIIACLAVGATISPCAWVRVAAVDKQAGIDEVEAMFASILARLDTSITEIAWFLTDYWPLQWLERLGFVPASDVISFVKRDLSVPDFDCPSELEIRPILMEELSALEAIEGAAFEPRWRHSAEDLFLAWRQSIVFEVALLKGRPVGFQLSTGGDGEAHVSRITVHPSYQGLGIGAALLASAMKAYGRQNIRTVTLNTQADNLPSRRLYERFGFRATGQSYQVWSYPVPSNDSD